MSILTILTCLNQIVGEIQLYWEVFEVKSEGLTKNLLSLFLFQISFELMEVIYVKS
jgi:hypothetical protein